MPGQDWNACHRGTSIIFAEDKGGIEHESKGIGSGMAAASITHRGFFQPSSQERYAEDRIQAALHRSVAGDAIGTSAERTPEDEHVKRSH